KRLRSLFEQLGHEVIATTRNGTSFTCELTDAGQVDAVVRQTQPAWIINCAAATSKASPERMTHVHVDGTQNLLAAVVRHAPKAVSVLFGSAAEYGAVEPHCLPVNEQHPGRPESPFGKSKLAQLHLAERIAAEHGLRVLVVR